jgi:2'-hydroxyisoflavone reductase
VLEQGIAPYVELPLWVPAAAAGMQAASNRRAVDNGLSFSPIGSTIRDTFEWDRGRSVDTLTAGLDMARERELLDARRQWIAT